MTRMICGDVTFDVLERVLELDRSRELEQTAVIAAGKDAPPVAGLTRSASGRPQLHHYLLSVEHAALVQSLSDHELTLLIVLSISANNRDLARRLAITPNTAQTYVRDLKSKTRMSRLQLMNFGYELRKNLAYAPRAA